MDFSKQPLYGPDYVCAVVLAIGLTIVFASAIRERNYQAWREVPSKILLLGVGSWATAFVIMFLGMVIIRWLPLAAATLSLVVIFFTLIRAFAFSGGSHPKTTPPSGVRGVIAFYFCATTLMLWLTIFARGYFSAISWTPHHGV